MKKIKSKILSILAVFFVLPFAFMLSACGEDPAEPAEDKTFVYAECVLNSGTGYTISDTVDSITVPYGTNIRDIITSNSFTVTVHYTNGESEVVTSGYTVDIQETSGWYAYQISVSYNGNPIKLISVLIDEETLPTLNNIVQEGNDYAFTQELRYDGQAKNVLELITTSENGTTLATLVQQNKATIDTSNGGKYQATEPNTMTGSTYDKYFFTVNGKAGSKFEINGDDVRSFTVYWTIKRAIVETPTLTSDTTFTYRHNAQYEGIPQGLTYNFGDWAEYITAPNKETNVGCHSTTLRIKDEYKSRYTFLNIYEEETTTLSPEYWQINPMELNLPTIKDGTFNEEDNATHYTYTGNQIVPELDSDYLDMFDFEYPNESIDVNYGYLYFIRVSLKEQYANSENYTFSSNSIVYYIDKADFPESILEEISDIDFTLSTEYNGQSYVGYMSYLSAASFTNLEEDLAKTGYNQETSSFRFSVPEGQNSNVVLNAGEYNVDVTYSIDNNHESINFTASLTIRKAVKNIYSIDASLGDNDNNRGPRIYRYNQPITLTVTEIDGFNEFGEITYTYSTTPNGTFTPVDSPVNAGYYKASLEIEGDINHSISVSMEGWTVAKKNGDNQTYILTYSYEIQKRPISILTTYSGTWGSYYYPYSFYTGEAKTFIVETTPTILQFATSGSPNLSAYEGDLSEAELNDIYSYLNVVATTTTTNDTETEVDNPTAINDYITTIACSLNANGNYIFVGEWDNEAPYEDNPYYYSAYMNHTRSSVSFTKEWSIISTSIDLSGVTWDTDTFEFTGLGQAPEIQNLPKGVKLWYSDSWGDYVYGTIGTQQSYSPSGVGTWYVRTRFVVDSNVEGYDNNNPPTIDTYPTGYDTVNDYFEQEYTITTRTLTLAKTDFAAYIYSDYDWIKVGDVDADGNVTALVPYSVDSQDIHIMLKDTDLRYYVQSDTNVSVSSANAGTTSTSLTTVTITPETNCQFANSVTAIEINVSWQIVTRILPANIQYYDVYLYVDGTDNDIQVLHLIDLFDNINAVAIMEKAQIPYNENTQYIYIKGQNGLSNYVTITYDGSAEMLAVTGNVGDESAHKIHVEITPTENCKLEENQNDATVLVAEFNWIIVSNE